MLDYLEPKIVIVYGYMPDDIFKEFYHKTRFIRYKSEFEETHLIKKEK